MNNYYHLSPEERALIMIEYNQGASIRSIGCLLNRSPSTICREVKRNLTLKYLNIVLLLQQDNTKIDVSFVSNHKN